VNIDIVATTGLFTINVHSQSIVLLANTLSLSPEFHHVIVQLVEYFTLFKPLVVERENKRGYFQARKVCFPKFMGVQ